MRSPRLFFSTTNGAFASGTEPGASALIGPGLAGLIVITPSIPDSPAEGVCPAEAQTAIAMSPKAIKQLAKSHCALYSRRLVMANDSEAQSEILTGLALDDAIVASKILRLSHA